MNPDEDILASLSFNDSPHSNELDTLEEQTREEMPVSTYETLQEGVVTDKADSSELPYTEKKQSFGNKFLEQGIFLIKYISTSGLIFALLLLATNYKAYSNIAYSYIFSEELERTEQGIISSVHAAKLEPKNEEINVKDTDMANTFRALEESIEIEKTFVKEKHDISQLTASSKNDLVSLDIEITPYENRIVIPRIGKNIPLVDIKNTHVEGEDELNDIFMDELEDGVVRYPGSAKPGQGGNSFIFGHSSNFPWMQGNYNDVFALLDHVIYGDEIIVYYNQKKYVYKIYGKDVIRPGDVSVLHSENEDDAQITLMTCWPIGTTLNRLIVTGDLISVSS